MEFNANPSD
jgi:hypothetical protein